MAGEVSEEIAPTTQQGSLFTTDQLTQIALIFRLALELVVRDLTTRPQSLQAQVTRVPQGGTAAAAGAKPVPADPLCLQV